MKLVYKGGRGRRRRSTHPDTCKREELSKTKQNRWYDIGFYVTCSTLAFKYPNCFDKVPLYYMYAPPSLFQACGT